MEHSLITTVVASLVLAFVFGFSAKKLGLPSILGYMLAGVLLGPYTPGFVADANISQQLAEIGIILLMFGVGMHFSLSDLLKVRHVAVPGALFQMSVATLLGAALLLAAGFNLTEALLFGLSLSVASTVVLLRTLEQRHGLTQPSGRLAVGWLIVEDIAMVLALVFLPAIAGMMASDAGFSLTTLGTELVWVIVKIGFFAALMIVFGQKLLPKLLVSIAQMKSRELTTLGTLAIALGFAYIAYAAFGASFALGAFLAGLVLSESEIGHKAAEQSLPMRDAFAVLFFVSVGMLFDPAVLLEHPLLVSLTLAVIIIGKALAALVITKLFAQPRDVGLTIAISLAQIGEFSFILAGMAVTFGLMGTEVHNLVLAGALLSIALNPILFRLLDKRLSQSQPEIDLASP